MTAQISDTFLYKGQEYFLIGIRGGELVCPEQFGMEPEMIITACYRGFYATYELTEDALYLRTFTLSEKNNKYLPIQGVMPAKNNYQATYYGLSLTIPFTGKLRLARDFIEDLYVHMGFQKPSAFRAVLDITLNDGKIIKVNDRSGEAARIRGHFKKRFESEDTVTIIEKAFDLEMEFE